MRKLILVRHSLPEIVPNVTYDKWQLSREGRRRCKLLAKSLADYQPMSISTSTERKAVETAEIIANHLGLSFEQAPNLHENDRTDLGMLNSAEIDNLFKSFFSRTDEYIMGRETADQARSRFISAVEEVVSRKPDGNVAIVAHGTVITLFTSHFSEVDAFTFWKELGIPSVVIFSIADYRLLKVSGQN